MRYISVNGWFGNSKVGGGVLKTTGTPSVIQFSMTLDVSMRVHSVALAAREQARKIILVLLWRGLILTLEIFLKVALSTEFILVAPSAVSLILTTVLGVPLLLVT